MPKKFDPEAYLSACQEGREILEYCKNNNIASYATLVESKDSFPEEKKDLWCKRLMSPGVIRFLKSQGIQ